MARLIDEILLKGLESSVPLPAPIMDSLSKAEVFKCDNVAQYFFQAKEYSEWQVTDFPNVAPPFPCYWIEFRGFDHFNKGWAEAAKEHGLNYDGFVEATYESAGVLTIGARVEGEQWKDGWQPLDIEFPDAKWQVAYYLIVKFKDADRKPNVQGAIYAAVDEEGRIAMLKVGGVPAPFAMQLFEDDGSQCPEALRNYICSQVLFPALLATSFLHCKNVTLKQGEIPPKLAKRYRQKKGRDYVQFKTLEIGPITRVLRDAGAENNETGLKKALHIARGHFATYTAEKPLFGKYVGKFWIPQHIRGRSSEGVVVKDYKVKAGA